MIVINHSLTHHRHDCDKPLTQLQRAASAPPTRQLPPHVLGTFSAITLALTDTAKVLSPPPSNLFSHSLSHSPLSSHAHLSISLTCRKQRESLDNGDEGGDKGGDKRVTAKGLAIAQPPKTEWETAQAVDKVCVRVCASNGGDGVCARMQRW